jgi:hypothetical protein
MHFKSTRRSEISLEPTMYFTYYLRIFSFTKNHNLKKQPYWLFNTHETPIEIGLRLSLTSPRSM